MDSPKSHLYMGVQLNEPDFQFITQLNTIIGESIQVVPSPGRVSPKAWIVCQDGAITDIHAFQKQIPQIPESIGHLTSLRALSFMLCAVTVVPKSIGECKNLEHIDLRHNGIASLPDTIGGLTHLKELHLGGNQIETLPPSIGNLGKLTMLELFENRLRELPIELCHLTQLQNLEVPYNALTTIPDGLLTLKSLLELDLYGNSSPEVVAKSKGKCVVHHKVANALVTCLRKEGWNADEKDVFLNEGIIFPEERPNRHPQIYAIYYRDHPYALYLKSSGQGEIIGDEQGIYHNYRNLLNVTRSGEVIDFSKK